jgi:hypothetical protein
MSILLSSKYRKQNGTNDAETKAKLAQFSKCKGISSDDYYGTAKKKGKDKNGGTMDKAKEVGMAILETAKDKMINVK